MASHDSFSYLKSYGVRISSLRLWTKIRVVDSGRERHAIVFVDHKGRAMGAGHNLHGCLGIGSTRVTVSKPVAVKTLDGSKIDKLVSGQCFVLALTTQGVVYAWGQNQFGQLGLGEAQKGKVIKAPMLVEGLPPVKDIACGMHHVLVLTADLHLYAFGSNTSGAVGNNTQVHQAKPVEITKPSVSALNADIIDISCGGWHSAVVTLKGELFVWGHNHSGQCGLVTCGNKRTEVLTPHRVPIGEKQREYASMVRCGLDHTLVLTHDGHLYAMGHNHMLQCGIDEMDKIAKLVRVLLSEKIVSVWACAKSELSVACSKNKFYVFGASASGPLSITEVNMRPALGAPLTYNSILSMHESSGYNDEIQSKSSTYVLIECPPRMHVDDHNAQAMIDAFHQQTESDVMITFEETLARKLYLPQLIMPDNFVSKLPARYRAEGPTNLTVNGKRVTKISVDGSVMPFEVAYASLFFYTSKYMIIPKKHLVELISLSGHLAFESLSECILLYVKTTADLTTLCHIYATIVKLEEGTLDYIANHCKQVVSEVLQHHQDILKTLDPSTGDLSIVSSDWFYPVKCHRLILEAATEFYNNLTGKLASPEVSSNRQTMLKLDVIRLNKIANYETVKQYVACLYLPYDELVNYVRAMELSQLIYLLNFENMFGHATLRDVGRAMVMYSIETGGPCKFYLDFCVTSLRRPWLVEMLFSHLERVNLDDLVLDGDFRRLLDAESIHVAAFFSELVQNRTLKRLNTN